MSIEVKIDKIMAKPDARNCDLLDLLLILDRFNFTKKFKVITIAGTNGKGTTVAMLEELLVSNNKQVLSHTSPHVFKFNERISLNKKSIPDNVLLELLERLDEITPEYRLSYYQIAFLCACMYSQKVAIDYLILEVGIGGRLDAANIIDADITAITNIDFDHCEVLGDTLDKIGHEKAGIARAGVPLFLGTKMPDSVYKYAEACGAIIYEENHEYSSSECFIHSYNIAVSIANYLFNKLLISYIPNLEEIRAKARFSILKNNSFNNSYVVVDVAHNPASVRHLFELLDAKFGNNNVRYEAVFGVLASKDLHEILNIARDRIQKWDIVDLKYLDGRAADLDKIKQEFESQKIVRVDFNTDLGSIYLSKKDTVTVVFGSFVLAGEFIKQYEKYNSEK
ncbi:bifunctional folylpolyglutamate synthase/dihydrofolate synthase [Francisella salina]|uniref:Dihydrofolate synthase/folylpolyglutamate synthase n=1 Tax=Francisella salina TaxID=573569 RepID=A0ABM5M7R8_FRAST|nr:Mur ligase family protein [Francisella salina]AEI35204.1 Dihydrofolate synthase / Folylpolyglutamate synthase [Francisella salina]